MDSNRSDTTPADSATDGICVLHVDDDPALLELTQHRLARIDDRLTVETATSGATGLEALAERSVDCIVSDYNMPGMDGIEFLRAVRDRWPDLPFILFTGKGSEAVASRAITAGVTDYLQKETDTSVYEVLANRIRNSVEHRRAARAAARSQRLYQAIYHSSLLFAAELTPDGTVRDINETALNATGAMWATIVGQPFWEVPWWSEESRTAETMRDRISRAAAGETVQFRTEYMVADEPHTAAGVLIPVRLDGTLESILALGQDITEPAQYLRRAIDALDELFFLFDGAGRLVQWNEAVRETTGYTESELASMSVESFIAEADLDAVFAAIGEVLETGSGAVTASLETADGASIPFEFHATRLTLPGSTEPGFVGVGYERAADSVDKD